MADSILSNKKIFLYIAVIMNFLILMTATACRKSSTSQNNKLTVATGLSPIGELIRYIGGDSVEVAVLLETGADPEQTDLSTTAMKALSKSEIFFTTGTLPFEENLIKNHSKINNINITEGIDLIWGTHGDEADPHVWMSLKNLKIMAHNVADAMGQTYPRAKNYFNNNLQNLENQIDSLDYAWQTELSPIRGAAFMIGHPSLSYFSRDYDLEQIPMGTDGHKEQTAIAIKKQLEEGEKRNVQIIFAQKGNEQSVANELSSKLNAKVVELDAMAPNTIGILESVVNNLKKTYDR